MFINYIFADVGVKAISVSCPQLRELSLSDCPQLTDHGLWQLARLGPSLRFRYSRLNCQIAAIHVRREMKCILQVSVRCKVFPNLRPGTPPGLSNNCSKFNSSPICRCAGVDTLLQAPLPQPPWLPPHNRLQVNSDHCRSKK